MGATALLLLAVTTPPAGAAWHASVSIGYPCVDGGFESVEFESTPVLQLALARRGSGSLQPRIAAQVAAEANGTSNYSWTGTIPDYRLDLGLVTVGGEFATRHRRATLTVSPGVAFVRWTRGSYTDMVQVEPARSWTDVAPLIALDGALHIPLAIGLELEPALTWVWSMPIHAEGADQGHLHQVQAHIGIGF